MIAKTLLSKCFAMPSFYGFAKAKSVASQTADLLKKGQISQVNLG